MIYQSLMVALIGMVLVFAFLMILIGLLDVMRRIVHYFDKRDLSAVAAAIAWAKRHD